jgi:mRNA-degrading endonuclease RelE of RelBE toxin-antitoxin system
MGITGQIDVYGVQNALKELNDIDRKIRRQVTKDIKTVGNQIVQEARSMVSTQSRSNGAPLSGMRRGSLIRGREAGWNISEVQGGFNVRVGVRATREKYVDFNQGGYTRQVVYGAKPYQLMVVQQKSFAGAIYDHVGIGISGIRNSNFIGSLNSKASIGTAPRVTNRAVENNREEVTAELLSIVGKVMQQTNRNLVVTRGN